MPIDEADALSVDWTITDADRADFAAFSGDHNPIHTDPIAARRLHGGRLLVHGAHLLLAALDQAASLGEVADGPWSIDVRFLHGVEPDRPLRTDIEPSVEGGELTITITADVWRAVVIVVRPADDADVLSSTPPQPIPHSTDPSHQHTPTPDDVPLDRLHDRRGEILVDRVDDLRRLFPAAADAYGSSLVAEIASLSCVVGMHAPGLRSLSSRYVIRSFVTPTSSATTTLAYQVTRVDTRLRRVDVVARGAHIAARIEAFSPDGPVDQLAELGDGERPEPGEFDGRRVLVVGGSRGLGAAAVELLRAGGADVRYTARERSDDVGPDRPWPFDTHDGPNGLDDIVADGWRPTSLCWFATPPYGDGVTGVHSGHHADDLMAVQVDAFVDAVDRLRTLDPPIMAALWPSSDARTSELRAAKLAGEAAATELRQRWSGLSVLAPRLPTMLTDQTRSLLPTEYADTASTLLTVLRELPG